MTANPQLPNETPDYELDFHHERAKEALEHGKKAHRSFGAWLDTLPGPVECK
jgi:hypothetical protein